jgi:hypothetical protein
MNELSPYLHSWSISCATSWVYIWTQLSPCLHKNFIFKKASLIGKLFQLGRIKKFRLVPPFSRFYSFHNTKFQSCFHNLDKFGDCASDCAWFLIRLWGLSTFGCGGWDSNCRGQSLILDWGSTPPKSVYNLCLVFRFGFATMSLVSLFLLHFQPRSYILH